MYHVDLNSDLGESFGAYTIGLDKEVIAQISSANVACGYHSGDPLVMAETGFGRRNMACSPKEVKAYMSYQLGALYAFAKAAGLTLQHVKPHGALYNMAAKDAALARAIAEAVAEFDDKLILLGLANSFLISEAAAVGLRTASEVFADRAYQADGSLVPRSKEGAVIHDKQLAIARTVRMVKEGKVTAITGEDVPLRADSICVHGDNPSAVEFVREIRKTLTEEGIRIEALGNFIK